MRVFLTGGTGLVGRHCAEEFAARGIELRALIRPTSDRSHLEAFGCDLVVGDISDPDSLSGLMTGCEVVVHCAAQLGGSGATWEVHERTNVFGTRAIVAESLRSNVTRLVHVSTVAVYGRPDLHSTLPINEESPFGFAGERPSHYERSKRLSESIVREVDPDRLAWVIVRPDIVVGEGDRLFTPRVVRFSRRSVVVVGGSGDIDLPVVYAGSVADVVAECATRDGLAGETFNITDDGRLTVEDLIDIAAGSHRPRKIRIPLTVFRAVGKTLSWATSLPGIRLPAGLSGRNLWYLSNDGPYSDRKIRSTLKWKPRTSTLEGWKRSVDWYDSPDRAG